MCCIILEQQYQLHQHIVQLKATAESAGYRSDKARTASVLRTTMYVIWDECKYQIITMHNVPKCCLTERYIEMHASRVICRIL